MEGKGLLATNALSGDQAVPFLETQVPLSLPSALLKECGWEDRGHMGVLTVLGVQFLVLTATVNSLDKR